MRDASPYCLELPRGIAVYPTEGEFPRLPLLGLRALISNRLHLAVDGGRGEAWLRSRHWLIRALEVLGLPPYRFRSFGRLFHQGRSVQIDA